MNNETPRELTEAEEQKRDIHVLPLTDLREHDETRTCWCQPKVERVKGVVVTHNSADGRELVERHGLQ